MTYKEKVQGREAFEASQLMLEKEKNNNNNSSANANNNASTSFSASVEKGSGSENVREKEKRLQSPHRCVIVTLYDLILFDFILHSCLNFCAIFLRLLPNFSL